MAEDRRRPRPAQRGRGRLERMLFSVMGPPQLGSGDSGRELPAPAIELCATCRRPYDEHEIVREPRLTYTRCPAS